MEKQEWINVKDKLPKERRLVIVCVSRHNYYPDYISTSTRQDGVWTSDNGLTREITHWMPLPSPPSKEVD